MPYVTVAASQTRKPQRALYSHRARLKRALPAGASSGFVLTGSNFVCTATVVENARTNAAAPFTVDFENEWGILGAQADAVASVRSACSTTTGWPHS